MIGIGGTLAAIGSVLPWITVSVPFLGTVSKGGFEGGDAAWSLALGVLGVVEAIAIVTRSRIPLLTTSPALTGAVLAYIAVANIININGRVGELASETGVAGLASVGVGLWVLLVGAGFLILGGIPLWHAEGPVRARERAATEAGAGDERYRGKAISQVRVGLIAVLGGISLLLALIIWWGGRGGYSEEFRTSFLDSCRESSGGQEAYCQCALEHLEENGPDDENDITIQDQQEAITACAGEVTG